MDDREWGAGEGTGGVRGRGQRPASEPPLPSRGAGAVRRHVAAARRAACAHPERPLGRAGQLLPSLVLRLVALTSCWPPPVRERGVGGTGGLSGSARGGRSPFSLLVFLAGGPDPVGTQRLHWGLPPPFWGTTAFWGQTCRCVQSNKSIYANGGVRGSFGHGTPPDLEGQLRGLRCGCRQPRARLPLLPGNRQHWECWEAPTGHWKTTGGGLGGLQGTAESTGESSKVLMVC